VHLISPLEDNFTLIKNARMVAVLTGTAGWEAIMLGIPVIVVGHAQYLGIGEGFVRCENPFALDESIRKALSLSAVPREKLVRFIAASLQLQSSITPRSLFYWHYRLNPDEVIPAEGPRQLAEQILKMAKLD
jgi:capsule polysaccharide export protein KpsC/LpsZ